MEVINDKNCSRINDLSERNHIKELNNNLDKLKNEILYGNKNEV